MMNTALVAIPVCALALASAARAADDFKPETIIGLERAALQRWGNGDVQGYLGLYAPEVTYFAPDLEKRADTLATLKGMFTPLAGTFKVDEWEMLEPKVQRHGDLAVLTYRIINYKKTPAGRAVSTRWNSTEVYGLIGGQWKIVHSHWSYTKPELKNPE